MIPAHATADRRNCSGAGESADKERVQELKKVEEINRDPREADDWFQRMPDEAQLDMRERWRLEVVSAHGRRERRRETSRRYYIEAQAVLLVIWFLGPHDTPFYVVPLVALGVGALAAWWRAGRARYCILGMVASVAAIGPFQIFSHTLLCSIFGLLGATHEMQREDFTET